MNYVIRWDMEFYWIKGLAFGLEYIEWSVDDEALHEDPRTLLVHLSVGPVRISFVKYKIAEDLFDEDGEY